MIKEVQKQQIVEAVLDYINDLEQQLANIKASLPKVRADAVNYAISECIYNGADGHGWKADLEQCAIQLEVGNE